MFYDIFTKLCDSKKISPTATLQKLNISTSKLTAWKKGSTPSASVLILLSEFFDVSIDYMLTGKEKTTKEELELSENEQELLSIFSQFSEREQIKVIGKVEDWLIEKQRRASVARPNVQTAYIASRSFDNMPPRTVTGDFSDVLNAPDSTDEY